MYIFLYISFVYIDIHIDIDMSVTVFHVDNQMIRRNNFFKLVYILIALLGINTLF